jgi:coatomer subunit gamma
MYLKAFTEPTLVAAYIKEGWSFYPAWLAIYPHHRIPESIYSLAALESKLVSYVKDPDAAEQPFDISSIPKVSRAQVAQDAARKSSPGMRLSLRLILWS